MLFNRNAGRRCSAATPTAGHFIRLANPISEEQGVMRSDLLPGLLETMRRNAAHINKDLKIFEDRNEILRPTGEQLPRRPSCWPA